MIAIPSPRPSWLVFQETLHFERAVFGATSVALGLGLWLARLYGPHLPGDEVFGTKGLVNNLPRWISAGLLIAVGVRTFFDRNQLIVDRTSRNVYQKWGFPLTLFTTTIPFSSLKAVVLRHHREVVKRSQRTHTIELERHDGFPIEVSGQEDGIHDELKGRHIAEVLARLFEVEMVEHLNQGEIHRDPHHLNDPLQKLKPGRVPAPLPPKVQSRFRLVERPDGVSLSVVGPPLFGWVVILSIVLGTAFTFFVVADVVPDLVRSSAESRPVVAILITLLYAVTMIPLAGMLLERARLAAQRADVAAGKDGLHVTKFGWFQQESARIPAGEIEELRIESEEELVLAAVSDHKIVRFGKGLTRPELVWIQQQLLKGLTISAP